MKFSLFIIFTITIIACNAQQSEPPKYPSYETMLTKFFTSYTVNDSDSGIVKFEKRKEGWFACIIGYDGNTDYSKKELYWDSKTQLYNSINFRINESARASQSQISRLMREHTAKNFAINQYYNYVGWDWNVIKLLSDKENLADTALYSLARAYSSYSSGLISGQSGLADASITFDLPYGENSLNNKQLVEYRKYQHLAIEKFDMMAQQSPMFATIIGSTDDKASSEYITSFYNLLIYQNEEEAIKELKEGLYSDFVIATAKNYLMSCKENAILFTNGDMDTYPLLYVQAQYNFRTDVKVINLSLLNLDRYVDYIQRETMGSSGIKLSLKPIDYRNKINDIIYIIKSNDTESITINELMSIIKTNDTEYETASTNGSKYRFFPTNKITLATNNKLKEQPGNNDIPALIEWEFPQSYLQQNNILLLDILANNNWERPVYFAITTGVDSYIGMQNYFQLEGLAYYLTPLKTPGSGFPYGGLNSSVLYDNLMNKFAWVNISSGNDYNNESELRMGTSYRSSFSRLINPLIDENKNKKAEELIEKCISVLPFDILPYDFYTLPIIEGYYRLGKIDQAQRLLIDFYNSQKGVLDKYAALSYDQQIEQWDIVRTNKYFVQSLYQLTTKYKDKASEQKFLDDNFEKYLKYPEE